MSLQVEKLEKNMAKLTIEVPAEEFDAAIKNAYNKNKNKFSIPGFRKGKGNRSSETGSNSGRVQRRRS